jgi:hypothetical protein
LIVIHVACLFDYLLAYLLAYYLPARLFVVRCRIIISIEGLLIDWATKRNAFRGYVLERVAYIVLQIDREALPCKSEGKNNNSIGRSSRYRCTLLSTTCEKTVVYTL